MAVLCHVSARSHVMSGLQSKQAQWAMGSAYSVTNKFYLLSLTPEQVWWNKCLTILLKKCGYTIHGDWLAPRS